MPNTTSPPLIGAAEHIAIGFAPSLHELERVLREVLRNAGVELAPTAPLSACIKAAHDARWPVLHQIAERAKQRRDMLAAPRG